MVFATTTNCSDDPKYEQKNSALPDKPKITLIKERQAKPILANNSGIRL